MTNDGGAPDVNPTPEDQLGELISEIGLGLFPGDVQDEVEAILAAGQSLEPATRARFVDAAKRGTRQIAFSLSTLEVLLFNSRREQNQAPEELGTIVHIEPEVIRAIERGERTIDSEDAEKIAAWADRLGLQTKVVGPALRRSLGTPVSAASYAGERELRLTPEQDDFVQRVVRALDERNDTATAE
ncbi:MAG: helix-turn-helix transcriptional regulator [Actinobacteria bacterium]|nr:helix-turn-helix transcriptional regulator [Actinomycetota bacterium]